MTIGFLPYIINIKQILLIISQYWGKNNITVNVIMGISGRLNTLN
ncbi:hypothetical protein Cst_c21620 [Thermoclostridium stercorarium subsp. stercorarium DSM 8532]|uniref:Uncharacterized protein n=1 Tax=Thermoclostridium stercorarium (strain ATCC 35414 / DSM 8532 / NCIMB 11754) TaxID=1121335 RepID=L7VU92_THES1|nr:hypothetical protein Cst_c21620 [Thermoclostridium stercorarium subsp. stercorarium DSM 8532]